MSDRPLRLRKAILGMMVGNMIAPLVTPLDVKARWGHLGGSGSTPSDIAEEANSSEISEERFRFLMKLLNSYL
jgi:hypothetical protein